MNNSKDFIYFRNTSERIQDTLKNYFGDSYNPEGILTYVDNSVFLRNDSSQPDKYIKTTFDDLVSDKLTSKIEEIK